MKEHKAAQFLVTRQLEKQDWYHTQEEPDLSKYDVEDEETTPPVPGSTTADDEANADTPAGEDTEKKDDDGIDFGMN